MPNKEKIDPAVEIVIENVNIARNRAQQKMLTEVILQEYISGESTLPDGYDHYREKYIALLEKRTAAKESKKKGPLILLTINPPDDKHSSLASLDQLKEIVSKILKKKWVNQYSYCFETRGVDEEDCVVGLHLHMLIHREDHKPSDCERELRNTVRSYYDDDFVDNKHWFNLKFCPITDVDKLKSYIKGLKKGVPKKNSLVDSEFRKVADLMALYESWD